MSVRLAVCKLCSTLDETNALSALVVTIRVLSKTDAKLYSAIGLSSVLVSRVVHIKIFISHV